MSQDPLRSLNCQHLELRLQTVQWDSLPWCLLITVQTRSPASIIGGCFKQILAPRSISALYEYCLMKLFFIYTFNSAVLNFAVLNSSILTIVEGNDNSLRYSCLEAPMGRGAWWAKVYRVAKSWIWLKWLSMHTCILTNMYLAWSQSFSLSFF